MSHKIKLLTVIFIDYVSIFSERTDARIFCVTLENLTCALIAYALTRTKQTNSIGGAYTNCFRNVVNVIIIELS